MGPSAKAWSAWGRGAATRSWSCEVRPGAPRCACAGRTTGAPARAAASLAGAVAQLDARPKHAAQLQHAVAVPQPPQDRRLERHLPVAVRHADVDERGVRLGGDAVDPLPVHRIEAVALDSDRLHLGAHVLRQRQRLADRAETCGRGTPTGRAT
eukprot:6199217-Prymnesium_polylepis.2